MVFSRWMWEPPATDRDGNYAIADYDLNLLLVVLIGDRDGISIYPYETVDQDKAVIRLHRRKPDTVVVSKDRNKLIVLFSNGTRLQADLAPRLAERIYKIMRSKMADSLLTEISDACNSEPMRRFLDRVSSQAKEHGTTRPSSSISDMATKGDISAPA